MTLELATPETAIPRVIGSYGGNTPGPLVMCIGGIARWFVVELLHLLGFRKQRPEGNYLVVSRRPHDVFSLEEWR